MQPSARWNHGDLGRLAQYFSLEIDGAWAELIRWENIRTEAERLNLRQCLWQCWVTEKNIADLETFDKIADCGLDPAIFVDDDHGPCRDLAEELIQTGFRGLVSPSAALPEAANLALFGSRREIHGTDAAGRNLRPDVYLVVQLLVEGAPPGHLLQRTRLYGDPHTGYEAWLQTKDES